MRYSRSIRREFPFRTATPASIWSRPSGFLDWVSSIRPLGAVLSGIYRDRAGLKAALTLTILIMAGAP